MDAFGGPAGLIGRMIGEEYDTVKAVAEKLADLQEILTGIEQIEDFDGLMAALDAAKEAAEAAAAAAAVSQAGALTAKNSADTFRDQAEDSAQAAAASATAALDRKSVV